MNLKDALGYIGYFVKSFVGQLTTDEAYRKLFLKHLGTEDIFSASEAKVKDLARHMFRGYIANLYTCVGAVKLASALSKDAIIELINDNIKLRKKYKIDHLGPSVVGATDVSTAAIDKIIKEQSIPDYKSVLLGLYAELEKPIKAPRKKPSKKKSPKAKAPKTKRKVTAKKSATPKKVAAKKSCKEYKLQDLKDLAKLKGLKGYSKLDKASLCKQLGLKN